MTAAERLAHYEDLFDLPENMVGEIIDGQLQAPPRPPSSLAKIPSVNTRVGYIRNRENPQTELKL